MDAGCLLAGLALWCVLSIPVGIVAGRMLRIGGGDG